MARRRKQQLILPKLLGAFKLRGWTYQQLGEKLGTTQVSACRKLNGKQPITIPELEKLAGLLGLEIVVRSL